MLPVGGRYLCAECLREWPVNWDLEVLTARDLQELQSRYDRTQRAHLPQEARMAVPEVQERSNAGAKGALA
jgi:hypothetical protein